MGVKYSFSRYVIAVPVTAAMLVLPVACNDDFGYHNNEGQPIGFKLTAPAAWHDGMSVNDNAPNTRCTSVQALSGGDTKLYLHTVEADNPAEEKVAETRGTLVDNLAAFTSTYKRFSLSGICYTGEYPTDEDNNPWTTEYAYNLYYSTSSGTPVDGGRQLLWPSNGKVRFFAFAPTVEDFRSKVGSDGSLTLSEATTPGSPTLTYTVPEDVKKQVDLMTVCKTATGATTSDVDVSLEFGHALTAVQIKCGKDMLAGKITEVAIAGVHGTGTQVIGSGTWVPTSETTEYKISDGISLSPSTGEDVKDGIHAPSGTPITGTKTDNLTFMLLPQTVPEGATLTIKFTDAATNTSRTLTGSIAGHEWKAGKIVTYSISPSSIHINAVVDFSKKDGEVIPYSGVWYDVTYSAHAEIVQAGVESKKIETIPADKIKKIKYSFTNGDGEGDCVTDANGLLTIEAQKAYREIMKLKASGENGSESSPFSLSDEKGETANCYLVDKAGYYSLALVYGNGDVSLPENNPDGFTYFPKDDDKPMPADGRITGVGDAVLVWQDSPDLIDPASVKVEGDKLVFRIREHTAAQGNAVVAVRSNAATDKKILWSWHIWVTPYKNAFYSQFYHSETDCGETEKLKYEMAMYNLGWCDRHPDTDAERQFILKAEIDMSAYGGSITTVDIGTFKQAEFKGSAGGDNTYYQWGRKDPMLGGIYNATTPVYSYNKKGGSSIDSNEFTMENKQVFNQYKKDGYDYSFCKNPGDGIDLTDYASNGATIGYTIMHPYMFITNSRSSDGGDDPQPDFNYRNHWHKPYNDLAVDYLNKDTHIMFNAWNAEATSGGFIYGDVFNDDGTFKDVFSKDEYIKRNATVKKSVYDPCPPQFKVPPIDAFRGIAAAKPLNSGNFGFGPATFSVTDNEWTVTQNGESIKFPATGVRNYALRNNEWKTITPTDGTADFYERFYKTTMPAFKMISFVSSATIVRSGAYNAYQLLILAIDFGDRQNISSDNIRMSCFTTSNNSYGLPVRPVHYN